MVAALPEAQGFALAGGGALVVHGLTERSTNDLDFFTPAPTDVPRLGQALVIAFRDAGLTVSIVRDTETFVRLAVGDGDGGFSPERLAESVGRMDSLDQADFGIDDAAHQALRAWVDQTRDTLERRP